MGPGFREKLCAPLGVGRRHRYYLAKAHRDRNYNSLTTISEGFNSEGNQALRLNSLQYKTVYYRNWYF